MLLQILAMAGGTLLAVVAICTIAALVAAGEADDRLECSRLTRTDTLSSQPRSLC